MEIHQKKLYVMIVGRLLLMSRININWKLFLDILLLRCYDDDLNYIGIKYKYINQKRETIRR